MNEDYSVMDNANLWLFTEEQLSNTPSRKHINAAKELSYRKQDATFIQEMGESMKASRLIINTAIVYMHRFYMIRSFTDVKGNDLCTAALFLSSKINDKPLKLEHVIKVAHALLHRHARRLDVKSAVRSCFSLDVVHPHEFVALVCKLIKASEDLSEASYFIATQSLINTTMCLSHTPKTVACVCINAACKVYNYKIQACTEKPNWFSCVDSSLTLELLESLSTKLIEDLSKAFRFVKQTSEKDVAVNQSQLEPSTAKIIVRIPRRLITLRGVKPRNSECVP
ncbi:cyclin-T1 [Trichonephila inaurata madagascariensis]|uniref:Cyclin-T1 n=1 Tax=Trichonephila inaurata madagascariensis TaxID=2747483 RepID=A0A8X7C0Z8_9ARAC|nr:cyclin-T1 [Trichonephila inaurata madagascariensis]